MVADWDTINRGGRGSRTTKQGENSIVERRYCGQKKSGGKPGGGTRGETVQTSLEGSRERKGNRGVQDRENRLVRNYAGKKGKAVSIHMPSRKRTAQKSKDLIVRREA